MGKVDPELDIQKETSMFLLAETSLPLETRKAEQHHSSRILSL